MLQYWIWLAERKHISAATRISLLEYFGSPEAVFLADAHELQLLPELNGPAIESLMDKDLDAAEKILRLCDERRVSVLTYGDAAYPDRLRNIYAPPLVLYFEGRLPMIDQEPVIGMVGTRKASAYGLQQAKRLGYQLSRAGFVVVSGAARGIDTQSLEGALTGDRPVIAVLGNGTDVVYPRENRRLYEDIRANGCLISEYPPGSRPLREHFPVRNRIISGLAVGLVVVEADRKSGAMITARDAIEQGRDLFAVPGNVGVSSLTGNLQLLREGAYLVENCDDVASVYAGQFPAVMTDYRPGSYGAEPVETMQKDDGKSVDKPKTRNYIDINTVLSTVRPAEAEILKALQDGPVVVDELIDRLQISTAQVLSGITMLEIRHLIRRLPGNHVSLAEADQNENLEERSWR